MIRDRGFDLQGLRAVGEGAEVRHRPVQVDQLQQALDEPCRLSERHAKQHPHRQAGLDRGIAVVGLPTTLADRRSLLDQGGIKPDRQRVAALATHGRLASSGSCKRGCGSAMQSSYHTGFAT